VSSPPAPSTAVTESSLLLALRDGDEWAFTELVRRHHASLRRVARAYVSSESVADEVVQETWLAVVVGIDRFEGRSSIKTWLFSILVNIARTRGVREKRCMPFSELGGAEPDEPRSPSVPPERFQNTGDAWPGHWASPPRAWENPERRLACLEAREHLREALGELPSLQQTVVTLRDVEGLDATEVCRLLGISDGNQRVLLHRGRARLRAALETYMEA
jgi:RNA polymerase sigma-70 factor, ECF subfamily